MLSLCREKVNAGKLVTSVTRYPREHVKEQRLILTQFQEVQLTAARCHAFRRINMAVETHSRESSSAPGRHGAERGRAERMLNTCLQ